MIKEKPMLETISLLFYNIKKPFLNSLQFATHQLGIRVSLILIKMFVHQNGISNLNAFTAKYDVQWPRTPPRLGFWDPFSELLRTTKASLSAVLSLYLHTVPGDLKYVHLAQCGNFMIFLSLRFYVISILDNLEFLKMPFLPFLGL